MHAPSLISQLIQRFSPAQVPVSRRAFLRASAASGAALFLGGRRARASHAPQRVVIVGAGFSGLACAVELAAAGMAPVVLEARNRVGGRVCTVQHPKMAAHAEAGAEFIGQQHHVWRAYAQRFALPLVSCFAANAAPAGIVVDGQRLDIDTAFGLYEEMRQVFVQISRDAAPIDALRPWLSPRASLLDHTSVAAVIDAAGLSPLCRKLLHAHFANESASPTDRQSYLGFLATVQGGGNEAYWTQTEAFRCASGNQSLALALASALPDGALKLGCAVQRIARDGEGMQVLCHDGSRYICDVCVVAVPPTTFGHIDFAPALPAALAPQMGPAIKHLAWFDKAQPPKGQALIMSEFFGTMYPMLHTEAGSAGDMFFCAADSAAAYRALSPEARAAARMELTRQSETLQTGHATSTMFFDWPQEHFTKAGYSCQAVGEVTRCGPLWDAGIGPLQFVGEHTHAPFVGFMEGALRSGVAMAARLARATSSSPF